MDQKIIQEETKEMESEEQKAESSEQRSPDELFALKDNWITLNVGGKIYETTKNTLISQKDSMLERVSSYYWIPLKSSTNYPRTFRCSPRRTCKVPE